MTECEKCGRDDGHYIGCANAPGVQPVPMDPAEILGAAGDTLCAQPGCPNPKRPKGKGPAPKYCEEHSDPKNRK